MKSSRLSAIFDIGILSVNFLVVAIVLSSLALYQ